ncbi:hypothetical protein BU17DRAFT_42485 [Hysterangium stoloniferum]|nr:hypothetical protein BU17DRAFT_42485 [Hysterangium stoloniferum]
MLGIPSTFCTSLFSWLNSRKAVYTSVVIYLCVVRLLRYRRVRRVDRNFVMTPTRAQEIMLVYYRYEFPWTSSKALGFALFKTYGIPTISKILNKTQQLTDKGKCGKRYMDTSLLIGAFMTCPMYGTNSGVDYPDNKADVDPRSAIAIARINWLHSQYPSISNDDFLYTLSVFIYEPVRWYKAYEWRELTELECQASFIFWAEIGRRMGIQNIPASYKEFLEWSEAYERDHMVPDDNNKVLAERTIELLIHKLPNMFKPFARILVSCLMEDRLRNAMLIPPPPALLKKTVHGIMGIRTFVIKHFFLPRIWPRLYLGRTPYFSPNQDKELPRLHSVYYENEPWYRPESRGLSKLAENIRVMLGLASVADFPGPHFQSKGYRFEELGPAGFSAAGHDQVMRQAEEIQGCPVVGPFSLGHTNFNNSNVNEKLV